MSSSGAADFAAAAVDAALRADASAADAEVLDWAPPSSLAASTTLLGGGAPDPLSGEEEEEIVTGFVLPTSGSFAATGGLDMGVQTEAHVFISNFAAGATDGELAAAVGALSSGDLARPMAACTAAQPAAGPATPAITSPSSSSGILPPATTTLSPTPSPLPPPSASSTAPAGDGPVAAWLAPSGAQSSVVPGPSAAEARQYWTDQEAMHQVAEPAAAANIAVPDDDDADLEGESWLDAYLAGFSGALPKAPPDTTLPMPFGAFCPAGATVRWPTAKGLTPPPPPPPSSSLTTSASSVVAPAEPVVAKPMKKPPPPELVGQGEAPKVKPFAKAPPPPLVVEPDTGAGDQEAPQRQPSGLFGSASPSSGPPPVKKAPVPPPAAAPAVEEPTPYERQRRAIDQENALRMGPMGFDVSYDEMLQLRIQRELQEMSTPPPPAKPAGQQPPEVIVPQWGADPERDHPPSASAGVPPPAAASSSTPSKASSSFPAPAAASPGASSACAGVPPSETPRVSGRGGYGTKNRSLHRQDGTPLTVKERWDRYRQPKNRPGADFFDSKLPLGLVGEEKRPWQPKSVIAICDGLEAVKCQEDIESYIAWWDCRARGRNANFLALVSYWDSMAMRLAMDLRQIEEAVTVAPSRPEGRTKGRPQPTQTNPDADDSWVEPPPKRIRPGRKGKNGAKGGKKGAKGGRQQEPKGQGRQGGQTESMVHSGSDGWASHSWSASSWEQPDAAKGQNQRRAMGRPTGRKEV
ncbi:unnamed protein product, partial [Symbiodinium sp. CCMP2592]